MPEKPEVMTVAKALDKRILHRTITGCNVYWDNIIAQPSVSTFKEKIVGQTIQSIKTRGKFIVIELDQDSLLIHLRMEGKFLFRKLTDAKGKHEHVELILDRDTSFRYHDVRKFGKMYLVPKEETYGTKPLKDLGPEFDDKELTGSYLLKKFQKRQQPIKTTLLDQRIIAGIGNIYDDEILFKSRIHPLQESCSLKIGECNRIVDNTKEVLSHAVELGGTTIRSFTSSEGVHGLFQNELQIHGKKICPLCGTDVTKIMVNGRGTYFCKKCQKLKKK
ncbi:MAG: DNA-formamidopyrimidine glycosylase [Bacilli bacterium]|nr:DNA-formamidopyrimidine glycosylase [Bacilli bacterium]